VADIENCFIKSNVRIATASGWLERLVRRPVEHGSAFRFRPHAHSTKSSPPQSDGSESKIVSESVHGRPHGSTNEH
jgi:hypothetical protein